MTLNELKLFLNLMKASQKSYDEKNDGRYIFEVRKFT